MLTIEEAALCYGSAWNEEDEEARRVLLERCFAKDGVVISNYERLEGREALAARIAAFRRERPGDRGVFTSGVEHHHGFFRFTAVVVRSDGSTYSEALDIGEVGVDGRITKLITFFGPLPVPPASWPAQRSD